MPWVFNPFTGALDFVRKKGSGGGGGEADTVVSIEQNFFVEVRDLTALEAFNKQVQLATTPASPAKVTFDLIGGTPQTSPDDFEVIGDIVSWDGKTLETVLATGDKIRLIYII